MARNKNQDEETKLCSTFKSLEDSYSSFRKNYLEFLSFARKIKQVRNPSRKDILIYFAAESYVKLEKILNSIEQPEESMGYALRNAREYYPEINKHINAEANR